MSYKRTTEGKRRTLAHKAARLSKYAVRPLDADAVGHGKQSRYYPRMGW